MTATAIFIKHNDRLHIWRKHTMNPLHMVFKALLLLIPTTDYDVSTVIMSVNRKLDSILHWLLQSILQIAHDIMCPAVQS